MAYNNWVSPKDAAKILGMSKASITRCRKQGAPVRAWGPTGKRYLIDIPAFVQWMNDQGNTQKEPPVKEKFYAASVTEMIEKRHAHIARIAKEAQNA